MIRKKQGLSIEKGTAYFSLYAPSAIFVDLGIFYPNSLTPKEVISMEKEADVWVVTYQPAEDGLFFAYRVKKDGPWLADPFTKALNTSPIWGKPATAPVLSPLATPPLFNWEDVHPPNLSKQDLVIYEMHVRGFTQHASSNVENPGTFEAVIEKIPYLKSLGINCIELMPIFEFNECKNNHINYWGYDPLSFFAPKRSFAKDSSPFGAISSFQKMVKALHQNQIEVILDVVYNHTGESDGHLFSLRGIEKSTYYILQENGADADFTGCSNTVNCNHPQTTHLILESLRYWSTEMGVDGFRFDLASILTRGMKGETIKSPPILMQIAQDPILSQKKLIAEAWDAAGLYQLGYFPSFGRWSEWNGQYRDIVRSFIKGTNGKVGKFSSVLCGTDFVYRGSKTPLSSVNFITAHDGFCLYDLVSYNSKHNEANGENNRDGTNDHRSWNCGEEGPTQNTNILRLRERQIRNFFTALFISQGIPMILMGDEYGHTRHGNNNPYVQDNELNWFLWDEMENKPEWIEFVQILIQLRKHHRELKYDRFLKDQDIVWHGIRPYHADWSDDSRFIAFEIGSFYIAFNASYHAVEFNLPNGKYSSIIDTSAGWKTKKRELPKTLSLPSYTSLIAEKEISG